MSIHLVTDRQVDQLLTVRPDRTLIRAHARSERFLLVDVVAPTVAPDPSRRRPPVNLSFVLDRSGSMGGQNKLGLAKQAVVEAIHRLEAEDRFSVVVYDDQIEVAIPSTVASTAERARAAAQLGRVDARGSTDLHGGWLTGCEQVAAGLAADGVNRVLLLTDGLANVGIIDHRRARSGSPASCAAGASRRARSASAPTSTSRCSRAWRTPAAGTSTSSATWRRCATTSRARWGRRSRSWRERSSSSSSLPDGVRVDAAVAVPHRAQPGGARVFLGDMVSGQVLSIVLRVTFDFGEIGREVGIAVRVADRDGAFAAGASAAGPVTVAWRYADHAANDSQPRDRSVDRVVARLFAERARQEAVALNRAGRYDDAAKVIDGVRRRVAAYAGSDPELQGVVTHLAEEKPAYAAAMPELMRKQTHFAASVSLRSRSADGKSQTPELNARRAGPHPSL